jgi:hypothetical protein
MIVDHQLAATIMRSTTKSGGQALVQDDDKEDDKSGLVAVTEDKAVKVMDLRDNREIRPKRCMYGA